MKTSELKDAALDWAVCEAAGLFAAYPKVKKSFIKMWQGNSSYYLHSSTDWAQGGPIIEREGITVGPASGAWVAGKPWADEFFSAFVMYGPTPLTAAMRCYVASKLGDEVEIPEELK